MKNFIMPAIMGAIAIVVVIVTVLVVSGGSGSGLYVTAVTGSVVIGGGENEAEAVPETKLSTGNIITVKDGSCTLVYRTKGNRDSDYIILLPSTQVIVNGDFKGKDDSEIYLNRGSILVNGMEHVARNPVIRTENSSLTTADSCLLVKYQIEDTDEGVEKFTDAYVFGGYSYLQLYDLMGNAIDRDGNQSAVTEPLGSGFKTRVRSSNPPSFEYLNNPFELSEMSSTALKNLYSISKSYQLGFASDAINEAYHNSPIEGAATETTTETTPEETTVTTVPDVSVSEETTTVPETEAETTAATTTTARQTTTAATTTKAPVTTTTARQTTAAVTTTKSQELITVYIIVDDEITEIAVPYGDNAQKPADPVIPGKKFRGWDGSFNNITSTTTITAMFDDDDQGGGNGDISDDDDITNVVIVDDGTNTNDGAVYTVTIDINGQTTTQQVVSGGSANLPSVNVPGYTFVGWDNSGDNITSDTTIYALLVPVETEPVFTEPVFTEPTVALSQQYVVTFVIDGVSYPVTVNKGENAIPPIIPSFNSAGQPFIGWDNTISNVNGNITVNAVFG